MKLFPPSADNVNPVSVALYGIAGAIIFATGFQFPATFGYQPTKVINVPVQVQPKIGSYADAVKVLGKPDTEVDGAQVNPQLAGATCGVWSAKKLVVCG